jgi:hypothetical protein
MPTFEQKTVRDSLLGMVHDHLMKGQISCGLTCQIGCELVGLLASYREEDRRLYPEIYLLGPSENELLNVLFPGSARYVLGKVAFGGNTEAFSREVAIKSLKTCASLALDGWAIFIGKKEADFLYGLFRPAAEPYSGSVEETLGSSGLPAAIFRNSAEQTVEIVNSAGDRLEISLTTAKPSTMSMSAQIADFCRTLCLDLNTEAKDQIVSYFARVLTESLRSSHGALLAIVPMGDIQLPEGFQDGVVLPEPISLAEAAMNTMREKSGEAVSQLRSCEALLRGMIMNDGATILGTNGTIRAFRVFVDAVGVEGKPVSPASGGARFRAFQALKQRIGSPIRAVLFRSQDGRTEITVQP